MINNQSRAMLIDFSHAIRFRTNDLQLDEQVVSYSHRAPELFEYKRNLCIDYDEKIDVWSIGIVLFEMVVNKSMYNLITTNGEEKEVDAFFTQQSEDKYIDIIKKTYYRNKRTLIYADTYWKWINIMIRKDADNRLSAAQMYDIVVSFARESGINVTLPSYSKSIMINKFNRNKSKIDVYSNSLLTNVLQKTLYERCILLLDSYIKHCAFEFNNQKIKYVVRYLIYTKTINNRNKNVYVMALLLLIGSAIYDQILSISNAIKYLKKKGVTMQKTAVIDAMKMIMQYHEKDLFLFPRFDFNHDLDNANDNVDNSSSDDGE
jgi:serine/threonine protein kinase